MSVTFNCNGVIRGVRRARDIILPLWSGTGNVIVSRLGVPRISTDPVSIILDTEFSDKDENAGLKILKNVIRKEDVGCNTTMFIVLLDLILSESRKMVLSRPRDIVDEIRDDFSYVKEFIRKKSRVVSSRNDILSVCNQFVSGEFSDTISSAFLSVGKGGNIVVECGKGTSCEMVLRDGMEIPYGSQHIESTLSLDQPMIAIIRSGLSSFLDIQSVVEESSVLGRPLVIFSYYAEREALSTWHMNKKINDQDWAYVPICGRDADEWMDDVAALSGSTVVDRAFGMDHTVFDKEWLGSVQSMTIENRRSTITGYELSSLDDRISFLRSKADHADHVYDRDKILERASRLDGGYCCIRVGGFTEVDSRYNRKIVEDVVKVVNKSLSGGVVDGGGRSMICDVEDGIVSRSISGLHKMGRGGTETDPTESVLLMIDSIVSVSSEIIMSGAIVRR